MKYSIIIALLILSINGFALEIDSTPMFEQFESPDSSTICSPENMKKECFTPKKQLHADGSTYKGYMLNGRPHGYGVYLFGDNAMRPVYEGMWEHGRMHGAGIMIKSDSYKKTKDDGYSNFGRVKVVKGLWEKGKLIETESEFTFFMPSYNPMDIFK